jgi:hypothetical protein
MYLLSRSTVDLLLPVEQRQPLVLGRIKAISGKKMGKRIKTIAIAIKGAPYMVMCKIDGFESS